MSDFSVNDHLEGILSDFEALKRSFDIDDVDDIPTFSSASPTASPISPTSSHLHLSNKTAHEGRGVTQQSPSSALNNSPYHSHRSRADLGSSPALKSRSVSSSLSFNHGSMNKPASQKNGNGVGGVTRAASFHNRFHPNGYYPSMSGPGSDNDSLHSSSSSLEYSGVGGPPATGAKYGISYSSPTAPLGEYQHHHHAQRRSPTQGGGLGSLTDGHPLKGGSSHGSIFLSEPEEAPGCVPELRGMGHGFMPSLDLHIGDRGGGEGGGTPLGLRYANTNWNGRLHHNSATGMELHSGSNDQNRSHHHHSAMAMQSPQPPRVKEPARLNKFPLDLENLTINTAATKSEAGAPKPPPRSTGGTPQHSTSPSASLSSLESHPDTSPLSLHHPLSPFSQLCSLSPSASRGSIPVPGVSRSPMPLSPAQTPQLQLLSGPQVVHLAATGSGACPVPSSAARRLLEESQGKARDSVGSILQRIASFSHAAATDGSGGQAGVSPKPHRAFSTTRDGAPSPALLRREGMAEARLHGAPVAEARLHGAPPEVREEQEEKGHAGCRGGEEEEKGHAGERERLTAERERERERERLTAERERLTAEREREVDSREREREVEGRMGTETKRPPAGGPQGDIIRGPDLFGYVGIEAVLDQMRRKTMKAGFEFNIMVVGQSGLGKSTLVNTLFKSKVSRKSCTPNYEEKISKTVKLQSVSHVIEEKGVKMKLTVIDTPGFGDQINNNNCWEPIVKHINEQYEKYLKEELHVNRKRKIPDTRIHCCVYFLPASGHWLRPIDIEFMKRLGKIVSIVPVIAKADTLTIEERLEFKQRIRQDLLAHGIQVYPQKEYDEDAEERLLNDRIRESIPFAVVGTDREHQVNGHKVLGRKTKWGIIEVENVAHCEFANLRDLLIRSHLQDLKQVTHDVHYETYRVQRLTHGTPTHGSPESSDLESHL
ncbi:unnamed protein product [Lota lota]